MSDSERDPDRLAEGTGLGAELLRSGKGDAPEAGSREQAALRLGLAAAGAGELAKTGAGLAFVAKLGAVLVAAATVVGVSMSHRAEPPKNDSKPSVSVEEPPPPNVSSLPVEEPPSAPSAKIVVPKASATIPKATEEELAVIAEARNAVSRGDQVSANAALDRYAREYPKGVLAMEAGVLRVEALVRWGERDQAQKLARELLAREPNGPQAERLRDLLRALQ